MSAASVARVRRFSDAVVAALEREASADFDAADNINAIMGCLDAAVRILRAGAGLDAKAACRQLARVVEAMSRAEPTG